LINPLTPLGIHSPQNTPRIDTLGWFADYKFDPDANPTSGIENPAGVSRVPQGSGEGAPRPAAFAPRGDEPPGGVAGEVLPLVVDGESPTDTVEAPCAGERRPERGGVGGLGTFIQM